MATVIRYRDSRLRHCDSRRAREIPAAGGGGSQTVLSETVSGPSLLQGRRKTDQQQTCIGAGQMGSYANGVGRI